MAEPDAVVVRRQRARSRATLATIDSRQGPLLRAIRLAVRAGFALVGWRVRVEGLERLPRDTAGRVVPCVLAVAPHRGWVDPFPLLLAWPGDAPRLTWFGDARTMARSRWRRWLLPRLGLVPIPPDATPASVREHLGDARTILGRGCCLVVFPEKGPPSPRGRTRTIAPGAAWLAAAGGVPLVPIALGGFLETGLGTRYRLRVLAPLLAPAGEPGASHSQGAPRSRSAPGAPTTPAGARAARATTEALALALAPAVEELEAWSLRVNGRRPLPGLRRLFR